MNDMRDKAREREATRDYKAWSLAWKRRLGWRAGLSFWRRDSAGGLTIASRHWPHLLCWSWLVSWQRVPLGFRLGPWRFSRTMFGLAFGRRQIVLHRQRYDYMPAVNLSREAPPINWAYVRGEVASPRMWPAEQH